jgi:hypothetical protein
MQVFSPDLKLLQTIAGLCGFRNSTNEIQVQSLALPGSNHPATLKPIKLPPAAFTLLRF